MDYKASHPGGEARLLIPSCYGNWDKLQPACLSSTEHCRFNLPVLPEGLVLLEVQQHPVKNTIVTIIHVYLSRVNFMECQCQHPELPVFNE